MDFQKLSNCFKTLFMTSKGLGENLKGEFSAGNDGVPSGGLVRRPRSEDPPSAPAEILDLIYI